MNGEIISIETANKLGKAKKLEIENIKLKSDNELYKHLYEIELKRNKELQEDLKYQEEMEEEYNKKHTKLMQDYSKLKKELDTSDDYARHLHNENKKLQEENERLKNEKSILEKSLKLIWKKDIKIDYEELDKANKVVEKVGD